MKSTKATVRLDRHCPTCGMKISIESQFVLQEDTEKMIGYVVKNQLNKLDDACPSKCPKCSKKDWIGKEIFYVG